MLVELSIRNLAVIESVRVRFGDGFHVLTGETGAGKSIIIDAISFLIGGCASADSVRYGSAKAEMEALFEVNKQHPVWKVLDNNGIETTDEQILIRREITSSGKSTSRINGQLVNLTMLREIGSHLVNIHGQHEHQSLLQTEQHIQWLDAYDHAAIEPLKLEYKDIFIKYSNVLKEMNELEETTRRTLQMIDLYRFQVDEITDAALYPGEEEKLQEERKMYATTEKRIQASSEAYQLIYNGNKGLDAIGKAVARISEISAYDPEVLNPLTEQLQSAFYQMEDAAFQIRDYRDGLDYNPDVLDQIECRLDLINGLRRKYGEQITDILSYLQQIKQELQLIENKDEHLAKLRIQAERQFTLLVSLAKQLTEARHQAGLRLSADIERELRELQMERTQFCVSLEQDLDSRGWEVDGQAVRFHKDGWDKIEFMIAPNPGEPLRSLNKIASGGELSRIMLAMKAIFANLDHVPVLIFDEVDTGVSGRAAQSIAEKLSALSHKCQVFSITHLPQVACMADAHYEICKLSDQHRTMTTIEHLDHNQRVNELSRMLGGAAVTDTTLQHAEEMMELANNQKCKV